MNDTRKKQENSEIESSKVSGDWQSSGRRALRQITYARQQEKMWF